MVVDDIRQAHSARPNFVSLQRMSSLLNPNKQSPSNFRHISDSDGVYIISLPHGVPMQLQPHSGLAKHALPRPVSELTDRWVATNRRTPTDILYVGSSSNLRRRIRQLVDFGLGLGQSHQGGQSVWQVTTISDCEITLIVCPQKAAVPHKKEILRRFKSQHGCFPFANENDAPGTETWWP